MQDEFIVSHGNFLEGYIKDLSLRMDKCPNGDYRIFVAKKGKDDMYLGTFTPAKNDDLQTSNAAHLPNGAELDIQAAPCEWCTGSELEGHDITCTRPIR